MEPDDLLCLRNARPEKEGKGSLVILLLAERARSECARTTGAVGPARVPFHEIETSKLGKSIIGTCSSDARSIGQPWPLPS
jgi:hypothetical protein